MTTSAQIEEFIRFAELEAGPVCCDDWFAECCDLLRIVARAKQAEAATIGAPLTIWSMSPMMGVMVPDSPRQIGRKQFYAVEDVDALLAQRAGSGGAVHYKDNVHDNSETWKEAARQTRQQLTRAHTILTAPPPQLDSGRDAALKDAAEICDVYAADCKSTGDRYGETAAINCASEIRGLMAAQPEPKS